MSQRKVVEVSTQEAKRQNEIIHILSHRIKGKGLKFCLSTFGCPKVTESKIF